MTAFRKAYRVEEAVYVQYTGENILEIRDFAADATERCLTGSFRIESFIVQGVLQPHLIGPRNYRVLPIEPKDVLVFTDGTIIVMKPSAFKRRWRLTRPIYRKGGKNENRNPEGG